MPGRLGKLVGLPSPPNIQAMMDDLYNREILRRAGQIGLTVRLPDPDATVRKESRLCGSRVTVDLCLRDGRVSAFGQEVKACALGQASAAILADCVIGQTPDSLAAARDGLRAMLQQGGPPPDGDFAALEILSPAIDYRARHASILLAFEAAAEAAEKAANRGPKEGEKQAAAHP